LKERIRRHEGTSVTQCEMRKIVFIAANEYVPWGGSESLWSAAAAGFARRGVQVYVSVKDWDKPVKQVEYLRSVGCKIVHRRSASLVDRISRRLLPRRKSAWEHVRTLGTGADLIVVSQGSNTDGVEWMKAAKSNGYKYAVIAQSAAELLWPNDDLAECLAEHYESACAAYFVSEANLALSRRQLVTPLCNGRVIRNPFNVRYDARPAWPGDPSKELFLACVGRLDTLQKGQDLLIEVLSLSHWRSRAVHVTLAGNGMNERRLRLMVDNRKLTSIEFAGFVNDIEKLWSRNHALVLPSRFEGLPLAVVEAMLCGRPCIVTDVAGNRELVRDGVNGFLAKAPTVELLDEAMNRAWDSRRQLMDMGNTAAIDVRQWVSKDPGEAFVHELSALVDDMNRRL
jgi:glycosyltransferase involved in cell wall biosynthesis